MSVASYLIKCVVDNHVKGRVLEVVEEDFFDVAEDKVIWSLLRRHYRRTGKVVRDWGVVYQLVFNEPGVDERGRVAGRVEWLAGLEVGKDVDNLKEIIWREFKEKEIVKGIKKIEKELLSGEDIDRIVSDFKKVLFRVEDNFFVEDSVLDVFGNVYDRLSNVDKVVEEGLFTGLRSLDAVLGGGLKKGSLSVWIGATSVGKTMMLVNQSVMYMLQGKRVLFVTLEDDEETILDRFDRVMFYSVRGDFNKVQERIEMIKEIGGSVSVLFKANMTVDSLVEEVERRIGSVDVLVIDYGDLLEVSKRVSEDWIEQGEVFERLMGLARRTGLWVVTASQASRQSLSAKVLTLAHVGRSFRKVQVAQYVFALVQSKDEEEKGIMRVVLLKNKFGSKNHSIAVRVIREYCWFREEIQSGQISA